MKEGRRALLSAALLVVSVLTVPSATPASATTSAFAEFSLPRQYSSPNAITTGPDGNLWFTESSSRVENRIGRITPSGEITEFASVPPQVSPLKIPVLGGITSGPGGRLWFTDTKYDSVRSISPSGAVSDFPRPPAQGCQGHMTDFACLAKFTGITTGADGNVWFTEQGTNASDFGHRVGRLDPASGEIVEFPTLTPRSGPAGITAGPDGNVWFTETYAGKIGRITPQGQMSEFALPSGSSGPAEITAGPDGKLWFTLSKASRIGRLDPVTGEIAEFHTPTPESAPTGITVGADGNLWFTETKTNYIGRITPSGAISEFEVPTRGSKPTGITAGPDGNVWFTEAGDGVDKIGRLDPRAVPPPPAPSGPVTCNSGGPVSTYAAWVQVAPLCTPRQGLAATTGGDGRIYAIGGQGAGSQPLAVVEAYETRNNRWAAVPSMPTPRVWLAAATDHDGRIYAIGGSDPEVAATVEAYDPRDNRWERLPPMPTPRYALAAATGADGLIYAIGGWRPGTSERLQTVEAYDPKAGEWKEVEDLPSPLAGLAAATGPDGRIYAIGEQVFRYDPTGDQWEQLRTLPTRRIALAAASGPDGRIYAMGGFGHATVDAYDTATDSWHEREPLSVPRGQLAAATGPDGRIYTIGGTRPDRLGPVATVEAYTKAVGSVAKGATTTCNSATRPPPSTSTEPPGSWEELPAMPTPRMWFGLTTGLDGCIYAIGGHRPGTFERLRTVEAYDPRTKSWESVTPLSMPRSSLAVATAPDGRIYAMGGQTGNSSVTTSVEAYDPKTNKWETVAPMSLHQHEIATAVSGGHIYVMGGVNKDVPAEPDPIEVFDTSIGDAWATREPMPSKRYALSAAAGPDGRIYAMGGDYMRPPALLFQPSHVEHHVAGQAYDPVSNSWSETARMPTPRFWMGASAGPDGRIYTVGGCPNSGPCASNAIPPPTVEAYDLCRDSWETAASIPSGRFGLATTTGADGRIYAAGGAGAPTALEAFRVPDGSVLPSVTITDESVTEPAIGTRDMTFTVKLSHACVHPVTLDYVTAADSAEPGSDFEPAAGTVLFKAEKNQTAGAQRVVLEPGETEATIAIRVNADDIAEETEQFYVKLANVKGATIADADGVGTIVDLTPSVSVGDVSVPEPHAGTVPGVFTVTLSGPAVAPVTVHYATRDGTAQAGRDYEATSGTVTVPSGATTASVTVAVLGDAEPEPTEEYFVELSDPRGARLGRTSGTGTILDAGPGIAVGDATVVEGNAGTTPARFTVTLNAPDDQAVSLDYATAHGTAGRDDYRRAAGTLRFAPGERAKVVTVEVVADTVDEGDETFSVAVSNVHGAVVHRGKGTGLILDDDERPPPASGSLSQPPSLSELDRTAPGFAAPGASGAPPSPITQAQGQSQTQSQAQAQQQIQQQAQQQAQVQAQSQTQAQLQQQVQVQAQAQLQPGLMLDRERELQLEKAHTGARDHTTLAASARRETVPAGTLLVWATALSGFALAVSAGWRGSEFEQATVGRRTRGPSRTRQCSRGPRTAFTTRRRAPVPPGLVR